jgi:phenylacetate-CoA ligase
MVEIFVGFKLTFDYFEKIYILLMRFNIGYIHAYHSTAYDFSLFLRDTHKDCSFIKDFLSGSENVFTYQVQLIENQLGIRFYNWYGHSEKLILGGFCNGSRAYHLESTYGYAELVDEKGQPIHEEGKFGELVGTTLKNPGMPLIRYKTGDFAEFAGNYCPICKRQVLLVRNIKGRWSGERVYNKDGTFVTTTALNLHDELYKVINGIQYIQQEKGKLRVLIIKSLHYNYSHEIALMNHLSATLKKDTIINIEYVDALVKQPNGKFLHLISTVSSS